MKTGVTILNQKVSITIKQLKTEIMKSGNNPYSKFFILLVLGTTMGFAQETSLKAKSDLSSSKAHSNPYFVSNELQGEMMTVSGNNTNPIEIMKQRTKSINTNERTAKHDTAKNSIQNIK